MEYLPPLDHGFEPCAALCRALHGKQQRQQPLLICRAGVFAKCLTEWKMLGLGMDRKLCRVRCQKRERCGFIFTVFSKVEVDPADEVPRRMTPPQEILNRALRFRELDQERLVQFSPQRSKCAGAEILRAGHHRRCQGQPLKFLIRRQRDMHVLGGCVAIRQRAEGCSKSCPEFSPV